MMMMMLLLSGVTGACKGSASYPEMVYPGHHGTASERFPTVAHRLQDLASYQGTSFASRCTTVPHPESGATHLVTLLYHVYIALSSLSTLT